MMGIQQPNNTIPLVVNDEQENESDNAFIPTNFLQENEDEIPSPVRLALLTTEDLMTVGSASEETSQQTISLSTIEPNDSTTSDKSSDQSDAAVDHIYMDKENEDENINQRIPDSENIFKSPRTTRTSLKMNTDVVNATIINNTSPTVQRDFFESPLHFSFRGKDVPVTYQSPLTRNTASIAISSEPFRQWVTRTSHAIGAKHIDIHGVGIDYIDFATDTDTSKSETQGMFDDHWRVDFIKITAHCTLSDEDIRLKERNIPGSCSLRGDSVGILVKLTCVEDWTQWSLLVDQPSVPMGAVSTLVLPEGTIDHESGNILGSVPALIKNSCDLDLNVNKMTNLTEEAYDSRSIFNGHGLCPSPGSCSEFIQIMSIDKKVTKTELQRLRCNLSELREQGNIRTLRVVPLADIWKISTDMKVMCALFLMERVMAEKGEKNNRQVKSRIPINMSSSEEKNNGMRRSDIIRHRLGTFLRNVKSNVV